MAGEYDPTLKVEWDGRTWLYTPLDTTNGQSAVIERHTGRTWAEWDLAVGTNRATAADASALRWILLEQNGVQADITADFPGRGRLERAYMHAGAEAIRAYVESLPEDERAALEAADPTDGGTSRPGGEPPPSEPSGSTT